MLFGNTELLNTKETVAVIGSRDCTEYGRKSATSFAKELSKKGICIVSGMAVGIDTAAHIGSVENIGRTIAVLGGGFNKIFPIENEWLFHKIVANGGCIITEYEPNVEAYKENFPKRNRIVSGLSDAILVVEAEYRSGTTITVGYGKEQGKIIGCLPSNIDSKCGIGTNILIKEGAELIMRPNEIIKLIENTKAHTQEENTNKKKQVNGKLNKKKEENKTMEKTTKEVPKEYKNIYEIIESKSPIHINDICKLTNKNITEVTTMLTMMEIEELVEQLAGNQFKIC